MRSDTDEGVRVLAILRDVVSSDAAARARGADTATDLLHEYSDAETLSLTFTLACCYQVETDSVAQEAQLHALAEFAEHGVLPGFVMLRVLGVENRNLHGSALEHLEYLADLAAAD